MSVLAAIAVLALLIVVHELGHFMAARLQGIHVNRFSIGFGPILWKFQGKETEYALRGIPLGGFVGFPDEDPESQIPKDDPDLLSNRPILDRAIVISAGVIANLIFAYFLLTSQVGLFGIPEFQYEPGVVVSEIASPASPAAQAGLQAEDVILSIEEQPLNDPQTAVPDLVDVIKSNPGQPLALEVQRGEQQLDLEVTPDDAQGQGQIGVVLAPNGGEITDWRRVGPIGALKEGADRFQRLISLTVQGFGQLISNFNQTAQQLAGPVGIVAMGSNIASSNAGNLFQFAAIISINLAFINILPLPALDGGQLAFLLIEAVRGKPLPSKVQESVMQTGLMLFLGLGIFLILRDTANLPWVKSLLQQ
ncbi:MAG: RIP metalloprotease RseP [Microcoleaceae cyanobacterium]